MSEKCEWKECRERATHHFVISRQRFCCAHVIYGYKAHLAVIAKLAVEDTEVVEQLAP